MGGRSASSEISNKGHKYGTEYRTVLQSGNIKFVKYNNGKSTTAPMETMTKGRVYVTVTNNDKLKSITYYDNNGKRTKQIDLQKPHNGIIPHTHHGYEHNENDSVKGASKPTTKEKKIVEKIKKIWYSKNR